MSTPYQIETDKATKRTCQASIHRLQIEIAWQTRAHESSIAKLISRIEECQATVKEIDDRLKEVEK